MIRFYIKDNQVNFSLQLNEFGSAEDANAAAQLMNSGYDYYIDQDTDHIRWRLENSALVEIPYDEALASTQAQQQ